MEIFNEYLRGKQFILFTDRKSSEKLGNLHTKTLNRLQTALLEHDFVVQYKKGTNMPADYLSRLPSLLISSIEIRKLLHLTHSLQIYRCCNAKTKTYKPFFTFSNLAHGKSLSLNKNKKVPFNNSHLLGDYSL
jgi:hypothetical protein